MRLVWPDADDLAETDTPIRVPQYVAKSTQPCRIPTQRARRPLAAKPWTSALTVREIEARIKAERDEHLHTADTYEIQGRAATRDLEPGPEAFHWPPAAGELESAGETTNVFPAIIPRPRKRRPYAEAAGLWAPTGGADREAVAV